VNASKVESYNAVNSSRNFLSSGRRLRTGGLLFEKILEGLARIIGARRGWQGSGRYLCRLRVGSGGGVFFDGHAELVELAVVFGVFRGDTFGDGLRALELGAGIEEAALLATVKLELALGTLAIGVEAGSQDSSTVGTPAARDRTDHARSARAELIGAGTALRRFAVVALLSFFAFFRVAVAAMTVLSIHKRLRPDAMPDCDHDCLDFCADAHSNLGMNPTGLLHSAHSAIVTQRIRTGLATSKQEMGHLCF
jgi:hypothetical protein